MKKKMNLKELSVKSFTTQLENERLQTAKGGEYDLPIVSVGLMCFSYNLLSCDCTGFETDCCGLD